MKTYKNKFFEFTTWIHGIRLSYEPCSYYDTKQISLSLGWGIIFIDIWYSEKEHDVNDTEEYWFSYHGSQLWFRLWKKHKSIRMPWFYEWIRTSYLCSDWKWEHETLETRKTKGKFFDFRENCKNIFKEKYPYTYTLRDWIIQETIATVTVEEREWRPLLLKLLPIFRQIRKIIDVEFSDPIWEWVWSWKGWTLWCSYGMKAWETPEQALRRMENERKFNR